MEKIEVPRQVRVYADKGYPSAVNRAVLKEKKLKGGIMRKRPKGSPMSEIERLRNKLISKSRWVIARTFGSIQKWFGGGRCRYLSLANTHFQNILESLAYNLYRVPGFIMAQRAK